MFTRYEKSFENGLLNALGSFERDSDEVATCTFFKLQTEKNIFNL